MQLARGRRTGNRRGSFAGLDLDLDLGTRDASAGLPSCSACCKSLSSPLHACALVPEALRAAVELPATCVQTDATGLPLTDTRAAVQSASTLNPQHHFRAATTPLISRTRRLARSLLSERQCGAHPARWSAREKAGRRRAGGASPPPPPPRERQCGAHPNTRGGAREQAGRPRAGGRKPPSSAED